MYGSLAERFAAKYQVDPGSGCWVWIGHISREGYGKIQANGDARLAHRISWELHRGPIPDGMMMDHLCRNRRCVNPDHLEVVTPAENMKRGMSPTAIAHKTERCRQGHDLRAHGYRRIRASKTSAVGTVVYCRECRRRSS